MDAVVTGLLACQIISLYLYLLVFIFVFACLVFAGILYFVFGFCTMSGVCDGCSGDWVIGLSNHINEAAQEEGRSSKVFMGALSLYQSSLHHFHHCHQKYVHQKHHDYLCQ